jgi:anion-transporting  ArsA/GET3 family ATPase
MSIRHRAGGYQARLTIDGREYTATLPTREEARDWERLVRARAVTGMLPRRTTVRDYAAHWLLGYDTAPTNTRVFHEFNLAHIVEALGSTRVSEVTPSDITRLINQLITRRSAALADRVYRTTSALFSSAAADGLCPNGSPVRSKKHRPRRQRDHQPVLERHHARQVLAALTGWQREAPDGLKLQRIDPVAETARYSREVLEAAGELDEDGRALLEEDLRSPCTEEIAVFRAFARTMAQADDAYVVLDTAPTGHTLLLLDASSAYHQQLASTTGEVADEVRTLLPRLRDPEQVRIAIVTLPESTPILEASRLADDLERAGITPYGWLVNASLAATGTQHPLLADRARQETRQIARVAELSERLYVASWRAQAPEGAERLREFAA